MSEKTLPRNTVAPKISKENMAYMITLAALCFSVSQWSNAEWIVKSLLTLGCLVFGGLIAYNIWKTKVTK